MRAARSLRGIPNIAEIKLLFRNSGGGLLYTFWIHSAEREWEIQRAEEHEWCEAEERAALRRARGERSVPPDFDGPW
jgi:hypothetical protein